MTAKERKQWLLRAVRQDSKIDALILRAERLKERATRITSLWGHERVSGGRTTSAVEDCAVELAQAQEAIMRQIDTASGLYLRAVEIIDAIPDPEERELMRLRYLHGKTWEECAELLHVADRTVYRMHGRALQHMPDPVMKCDKITE